MENLHKNKQHRNGEKVNLLYGLSPMGSRNLPLSTLKGLPPMEHCALNKGEFITVSERNDMCVTARGKVFSDDDPDSIISGYDYYYEMVDYEEGEIELTTETENTLPAPRSRKSIGVGEVVKITANVGVNWKVDTKLVSIVKRTAKELTIQARDKAGICTIDASYKKKRKTFKNSVKFSIVEPKGVRYSQARYEDFGISNKTGLMLYHPQNGYLGLVGLNIQLLPKSVNFNKVLIAEENTRSVNTGIWVGQEHCHCGECSTSSCGVFHVTDKNNQVNMVAGYDRAGGGDNDPNLNVGNGGSIKNIIPIKWSMDKSKDWKTVCEVTQNVVLSANGNLTLSKGNYTRTFAKSDNYPDDTFIKNKHTFIVKN